MKVSKEFTFDSAHFLKNYHGKCERLHGHTYKLRVTVEGAIQKNGLVIDFCEIKSVVEEEILKYADHANLNDIIEISSVENLCVWVWKKLKPKLKGLKEIRIWETQNSFATYEGK